MTAAALTDRPARRNALGLFAFIGGLAAWFVHLLGSYVLFPSSCAAGSQLRLVLAAVLPMLVAIGATAAGRAITGWAGDDPARARLRFMGRTGVILGVVSVIAIAFGAVFPILTEPCT